MVDGNRTAGRLPERSEAISGDERTGLTPIAAQVSKAPEMDVHSELPGLAPKVRPYRLTGLLEMLRRRPER
jgi:hypothetical protein